VGICILGEDRPGLLRVDAGRHGVEASDASGDLDVRVDHDLL
jgi:hypothetical protein